MDVPAYLVDQVRVGKAVLFLGAGASMHSDAGGGGAPSTEDLKQLLCDKFLGGRYRDRDLANVAEIATSEAGLLNVQKAIADRLRDLRPSASHIELSTFIWRAIVTTNYDLLLEDAWRQTAATPQELAVFLSNKDNIEDKIRSRRELPLIKLHGCISRYQDEKLPLILTRDQYAMYRQGRSRLFEELKTLCYEYAVIFVGHSVDDADLRVILSEVSSMERELPRAYLVRPDLQPEDIRLWETKRFTPLKGSFGEFVEHLAREIPRGRRALSITLPPETHPIEKLFISRELASVQLKQGLESELEYVHAGITYAGGSAAAFYRGNTTKWYPVINELDVRRTLTDTLLYDVLLRSEENRPALVDFYLVKAEAGAGKSVFLQRVAWEGAVSGDCLCLFRREFGQLDLALIAECQRLSGRRVFLFVDDVAECASELHELISSARKKKILLTVIAAERVNQWNTYCRQLDEFLSESYLLRYLSEAEAARLVDLLEEHGSLGARLAGMSRDERIKEFVERAGRQLLVALHEVTLGRPFEDILEDEFSRIRPKQAQELYLSICVLNRLNVPVRAGIISRVHGISFLDFKSRFLGPLEHVVKMTIDRTGDFLYAARHPEIAQIVFQRILVMAADRFHQYSRLLPELNLLYSTDREAFRKMVRAGSVLDLFPDHQDARAVYDLAIRLAPDDAYVLQQAGIYESRRANPNFVEASRLIHSARDIEPKNSAIIHSLGELALRRSRAAESRVERERYRRESQALVAPLLSRDSDKRYARHTILKSKIDGLADLLREADPGEKAVDTSIRELQKYLALASQEHPDDEFILAAEADFAKLIADDERAYSALRRASEANPRDPFIATRFSKALEGRGDRAGAQAVLRAALEAHRGDKMLNFRYALSLRDGGGDADSIIYHLRRAFQAGDRNFEARFMFARYAYFSSNEEERAQSLAIFEDLRSAPVSHELRTKARDFVMEEGVRAVFRGTIIRIEDSFGFVSRDGRGERVFFHREDQDDASWAGLSTGKRVAFNLAFSFGGAKAVALELLA